MAGSRAGRAAVVGAGIGGLAAAVGLRQQGWEVTVLERARILEPVGAGLGVAPNALHALDAIGLGEEVRRFSAVQGQGGIRRPDGRWLVRTDLGALADRFGNPQLMALRSDLVGLLAASLPDGSLRTGVAVTGVDGLDSDRPARVFTTEGELQADLVVAADGIESLIRAALFPMHPGPRYSGFTAWRFVAPRTAGAGPPSRPRHGDGALCSASSRSPTAGCTATPVHRRRRACVTMTRPPSWCGRSVPGMIRFPA